MENQVEKPKNAPKWKLWFKRAGLAGFLFFLIKGLIWLGLFAWFGKEIFK